MSTETSLRVSEIFDSIQGEGPSAGSPATFLRLATCNLRCAWCDTRYTWDWDAFRYEREVRHLATEEVARDIGARSPPRLIVTGGEPLLQQPAIRALLDLLPPSLLVEVETNGTLAPVEALTVRVDQWNVSPKLASSGEDVERRLLPGPLAVLRDTGRAWLKIVVRSSSDGAEVDGLLDTLGWPRERVLLMPEGATREALGRSTPVARDLAGARGLGVSPRIHVERWGGRRGV